MWGKDLLSGVASRPMCDEWANDYSATLHEPRVGGRGGLICKRWVGGHSLPPHPNLSPGERESEGAHFQSRGS